MLAIGDSAVHHIATILMLFVLISPCSASYEGLSYRRREHAMPPLKVWLGILCVALIAGWIMNVILVAVGVQNPWIAHGVDFLIGVMLARAYDVGVVKRPSQCLRQTSSGEEGRADHDSIQPH
jgi:hypothetical protein